MGKIRVHVGRTTEFVFHTDESEHFAGFKLCEEAAPATSVVGRSCTHEGSSFVDKKGLGSEISERGELFSN